MGFLEWFNKMMFATEQERIKKEKEEDEDNDYWEHWGDD